MGAAEQFPMHGGSERNTRCLVKPELLEEMLAEELFFSKTQGNSGRTTTMTACFWSTVFTVYELEYQNFVTALNTIIKNG